MNVIYSRSCIGYDHIKRNIPCQDNISLYEGNNCIILTACDGHGGNIYIRSDKGSKYASQAVINIISNYDQEILNGEITDNLLTKLKLMIICKWNNLIENDYFNNNFSQEEMCNLSEDEIQLLENYYTIAYGTTLNAVVLTQKYIICIQIGDGGIFLLKDEKVEIAIIENDDNVANVTNSLCSDQAFENLYIKFLNREDYDGCVICTDGLLGPYQTYQNFCINFIKPFLNKFKCVTQKKYEEMDEFIDNLSLKNGNGDDVSFSAILFSK